MPPVPGFRRRHDVIDRLSADSNLHALIVKKLITAGGVEGGSGKERRVGGLGRMVSNLPSQDAPPYPPVCSAAALYEETAPPGCAFLPPFSLISLNRSIPPSNRPSSFSVGPAGGLQTERRQSRDALGTMEDLGRARLSADPHLD